MRALCASLSSDVHARAPEDTMTDLAVNMEAQEMLLADMDTYSDWLASQCIGVPIDQTRIGYVPRDAALFARYVESLTVAQLAALSLYPRADVAYAAMQAIREKYIEQNSVYLDRLAGQVRNGSAS